MSEWQPIETAPKDGSSILLFGVPSKHHALQSTFHKPWFFTAHWDSIDEAFCINGGDWCGPFISEGYWMPLPEAPK